MTSNPEANDGQQNAEEQVPHLSELDGSAVGAAVGCVLGAVGAIAYSAKVFEYTAAHHVNAVGAIEKIGGAAVVDAFLVVVPSVIGFKWGGDLSNYLHKRRENQN